MSIGRVFRPATTASLAVTGKRREAQEAESPPAFFGWLWNAAIPLLLITVVLWSGNSIVGRLVRDEVPPVTLALLRWVGALALLMPFAVRPLRADLRQLRREWKITALLATLGVSCFNALLYSALHYTTASNAMLIQSVQPGVILLLSALLFRERSGAVRIFAVLLSILGAGVVVTRGNGSTVRTLEFNRGELLMLVAVLCWSLYTVLLRLRPQVHQLSFLAATFAIGAISMIPFAIAELLSGARLVVKGSSIAAVLYVAIFPSLIAYLLYNRAVELFGAPRAGQLVNLMPVAGAILAVFLLNEPLRGYHIAGGVLILAGVFLFMRSGKSAA
jgi:drug/metabolite transporter (DMT)-like permease